jgi:hypothetical protein
LDHEFSTHHSIEGNYAYLYVHPLDAGQPNFDSHVHNANVGYTYTPNPGLAFRFFGGVTHSEQNSFTGAAAVDKKFGDLWLSAGYQRYLAFFGGLAPVGSPLGPVPFGQGIAPDSIYQVVSLRAWGRINRRIGLGGTVQRALNGVTRENRGIKSLMAQVKVDYRINDRVSAFVRTEFYGQNLSEFTNFPMSRRRYFAGLEFFLSRAPETSADNPHRHKPLPPSDVDELGRPRENR